jgi:hypothetical protein
VPHQFGDGESVNARVRKAAGEGVAQVVKVEVEDLYILTSLPETIPQIALIE